MRNKKGEVVTIVVVAFGLIALMTTKATIETAQNGVLKNNGKKIWCKMQNKGNGYCDSLYAR